MQAKSKAEQAQIMMNNSSDSCSRQVSQLHKELRASRHQGQLLQGQLDTALADLQRKREKKQHYKIALLEETAQLQGALLHKDVRIGELNHRIDKVTHTLSSPAALCHQTAVYDYGEFLNPSDESIIGGLMLHMRDSCYFLDTAMLVLLDMLYQPSHLCAFLLLLNRQQLGNSPQTDCRVCKHVRAIT